MVSPRGLRAHCLTRACPLVCLLAPGVWSGREDSAIARRKQPQFAKPDKKDLRCNRQIRLPVIFLIDEIGTQVGEIDTAEALKRAEDVGLDLVEVSPNARPPVCKIMDYGKYKYKQKKRSQGQKTHQAKVKEVRMHPRTDTHDQDVRVKQAIKFLEQGDKVLVTIQFKGREMAHREQGFILLDAFKKHFPLYAKVEREPSMEGKKMTMLLAPLPIEIRKKLQREAELLELERMVKGEDGRQRRVISLDEQAKPTSDAAPSEASNTEGSKAEAGEKAAT